MNQASVRGLKPYVFKAMCCLVKQACNNITHTAKVLGTTRQTLMRNLDVIFDFDSSQVEDYIDSLVTEQIPNLHSGEAKRKLPIHMASIWVTAMRESGDSDSVLALLDRLSEEDLGQLEGVVRET